jgi:hypothetical protein
MYRVRWERSALDELAEVWMEADSTFREAITAATHAIDQELRSDPYGASESRSEGRRILFLTPLGLYFRVDEKERVVSILRVWRFRKRKR